MISIIEHIEYLLSCHDCVVVPGWGAFIANYTPAAIGTDAMGLIEPPRRVIGFSSSITHNDGVLAQSMVRREGISFEVAMRHINGSVSSLLRQLEKGNDVSIGRVGYFRRVDGSYNEFVPQGLSLALNPFYGLAGLGIKTVETLERESAERQAAAALTRSGDIAVAGRRSLFPRKATRIAASVAVLLGLGVMLTTPILPNRAHDKASLGITVTAPKAGSLSPAVVDGVQPCAITRADVYPGIAATGNSTGRYFMVIATLRNQQELDAFKTANQELTPHMKMLDYKGMTLVYVARSDDYSLLMSLRDELPEPLRDVWIYN